MNIETEVKKEKKQIFLIWINILFLALIISTGAYVWYSKVYIGAKRVEFASEFMNERYGKLLIFYAKKYGNDWLEELARIGTESEWDRYKIGRKGELYYYQIMPALHKSLLTLVKKIVINKNDKFEINLIEGNLHISAMKKFSKADATEIYNIGLGKYRAGRKNSKYISRYLHRLKFLEIEWREYKKLF